MQYEVEIKSLLGSEENAERLLAKLENLDSNFKLLSANKQLNHYFVGGSLSDLYAAFKPRLSQDAAKKLEHLKLRAKEFSVRTRDKDGAVLLVVKASVDDTTSSNGITRMEFEEKINLLLQEADELLLASGFEYQAKWSRERKEYSCRDVSVCLDKNAGYGWLAEFEKVVHDESLLDQARNDIRALMKECGVEELQQERLERMFSYYNANWKDYYGTDKVFNL